MTPQTSPAKEVKNQTQITIGKWKVPKDLFDEYVKFLIMADAYILKDKKVIDRPMSDYEISQRYLLCSKRIMEIHREICDLLKIKYTTDDTDEFYTAFHKEVRKQTRLKG